MWLAHLLPRLLAWSLRWGLDTPCQIVGMRAGDPIPAVGMGAVDPRRMQESCQGVGMF